MQQTAINLVSSKSPSQIKTNLNRGQSQEKVNKQDKEKKLLNYQRIKFKTDFKQEASQNDYELAKSFENLKQQLQEEQKIFVKKELHLQEQILQESKAFDKKLKFLNFQYQTKINDLKWELKMKDQEISSLNLQLSNFNLSRISEKLYQSHSSCSQKSNDIVKNFQLKLPQRSYKKEKKSQYQSELKRIRIQTAQFAEKFITEKNQISEDLEQLKKQKLMLQQLFQNKKVIATDRLFYESSKTMNAPNNNQRKLSSSFGVNIESQIQLDI